MRLVSSCSHAWPPYPSPILLFSIILPAAPHLCNILLYFDPLPIFVTSSFQCFFRRCNPYMRHSQEQTWTTAQMWSNPCNAQIPLIPTAQPNLILVCGSFVIGKFSYCGAGLHSLWIRREHNNKYLLLHTAEMMARWVQRIAMYTTTTALPPCLLQANASMVWTDTECTYSCNDQSNSLGVQHTCRPVNYKRFIIAYFGLLVYQATALKRAGLHS